MVSGCCCYQSYWCLCYSCWLGLVLILTLLSAHAGYLHLVSACCKNFSSCCNSWGLEQMVWALQWSVPTTLYLDDTVWLLSNCRYRSVWGGFLYTVVLGLPSSFGVNKKSKKGMEPSGLDSSLVNWIWWSMEFSCSKKTCFLSWLDDGKSFIYKPFPEIRGLWWWVYGFNFKILHVQISYNGTYWWAHGSSFLLFKVPALKGKVSAP